MHSQTQRTAEHVGWRDRGVVAPGYVADLNLIDFDTLACPPPHVVRDLPAGGRRLMQAARGYQATVKSRVVTFEAGEATASGRLLRGERPAPASLSLADSRFAHPTRPQSELGSDPGSARVPVAM